MQPLPVSYLGFMAGAGFCWNRSQAALCEEADWASLLDLHVFQDRAGVMGQLALSLGDVYRISGGPTFNASPLFRLLVLYDRWPPSKLMEKGLTVEGLQHSRDAIAASMKSFEKHQMNCSDASLIVEEFQWCADILDLACQLGQAWLPSGADDFSAIPKTTRKELTDALDALIAQHEQNWVKRNRLGGLKDSVAHLAKVRDLLHAVPTP